MKVLIQAYDFTMAEVDEKAVSNGHSDEVIDRVEEPSGDNGGFKSYFVSQVCLIY